MGQTSERNLGILIVTQQHSTTASKASKSVVCTEEKTVALGGHLLYETHTLKGT